LAQADTSEFVGGSDSHKERDPHDAEVLKEQWKEYLQVNSLNTTQQRESIVDEFLRCSDHVSTDELLEQIRRTHKKIGYATVYRTLKLLVEAGLAHQRDFGDGQTRYEVVSHHHDHLICSKCSLVLEFEDEEIERLQEKVAQRLGGFQIVHHRLELYGLCPKEQGIKGGFCPREERDDNSNE
jgi:Fur family ferric uptake transcriptional regulator